MFIYLGIAADPHQEPQDEGDRGEPHLLRQRLLPVPVPQVSQCIHMMSCISHTKFMKPSLVAAGVKGPLSPPL